jgi:hypothetical protein
MKESKLSPTQKLTFAAMLLALAVISTFVAKSISLPFLSSFPFLRFSLTPAIIIYTSITLGPVYGMVVGAAADVIPAFGFSTGSYNFLITIVYALFGILPWVLEKLTRHFRSTLRKPYFFYGTLAVILIALAVIFYATDWLDGNFGSSGVWAKPTILGVIFCLDVGMGVGLYFTNKFYQKRILEYPDIPSPNEIAIIDLVGEVVVLDALKALAFYIFYTWIDDGPFVVPFSWAFAMLLMGAPLNILISTFFDSWLLIYTKKFIRSYGYPISGTFKKRAKENVSEESVKDEKTTGKEIQLEEETEQDEKEQRRAKTGWIIFFTVCLLVIVACLIIIKIADRNSALKGSSSALMILLDKITTFTF